VTEAFMPALAPSALGKNEFYPDLIADLLVIYANLVDRHLLTRSASDGCTGQIPGARRRGTSSHAATLALSWQVE
jgi:hypothetical protein